MIVVIALVFSILASPRSIEAAISFVGSCSNRSSNGEDVTVTLPGGMQQNDLVLIAYAIGDDDAINHNMSMATAGYTEIADLYADDGDEANLGVYRKFMGATPDTTATANGLGLGDSSTAAVCMVFRGVDTTTPLDVTPTTATGLNTSNANPPSLNHNNPDGVWIVIAGGSGQDDGTNCVYTFPTGYTTNAVTIASTDTVDAIAGLGYRNSGISDPEDPGLMTNSTCTSDASDAWAAVTMALRPTIGVAPTVSTSFAGNIGALSANLYADITEVDGGDATEHGFAISTDAALASGVSTSTLGGFSGTGRFSDHVTSLSNNTIYYFRAYATNAGGTGYGAILDLLTGNTIPTRSMRLFAGTTVKFFSGKIILYGS